MRVVIFCHSLLSDWNHGNAHFLRGIAVELQSRGHRVDVFEPRDAWSLRGLVAEHGEAPLAALRRAYPTLASTRYDAVSLDLERVLEHADLVLVHEWNEPGLVSRIGAHRQATGTYRLLFHDTHHRAATAPETMGAYDLRHYDGVLAFGAVIRDLYLARGWARQAWTWHEAADTRIFRPREGVPRRGDVVWIGNWGDGERTEELQRYLLGPVRTLGLRARVHGVRYPDHARRALAEAGVAHGGWVPNYEVPRVFAAHRVTVHVPRRPYAAALPGIPTIRPFEALACGIPLVSAPWDDAEGLFTPGKDFLMAGSEEEMRDHLARVVRDERTARALAASGRRTVLARHTCRHRADELAGICEELDLPAARTA
jgi:spore maturation protein CgeB